MMKISELLTAQINHIILVRTWVSLPDHQIQQEKKQTKQKTPLV